MPTDDTRPDPLREALVNFVLAPGFAADRPSGPRTQRGHTLASSLRRRLPKVQIDYDEWVRDIEVDAVSAALAASGAVTEGLDVERLAETPIFRRIVDDTGTLESYIEVAQLIADEYRAALSSGEPVT